MYGSIWLEYYSLSLRYLENTGASAVCLLPKHPVAACLIWQSYRGTSHTHTSPAALYTDKGLLQVQSTSKTTGDTLPPRVVLPFGPTNAENISQIEQFLTTKERRDNFECHTRLHRSKCREVHAVATSLLEEPERDTWLSHCLESLHNPTDLIYCTMPGKLLLHLATAAMTSEL
ncbi:hypothetical protein PAMP_023076 [Pampus punctatissimus]